MEAGGFLITLQAYQLVLVWLQVSKDAVYKRFKRGRFVNGGGRKFSVTDFPRARCHWVLFCDKLGFSGEKHRTHRLFCPLFQKWRSARSRAARLERTQRFFC